MPILEFNSVTMSYGRGETRTVALDDVSFAVPEQSFCILLGPSGAGKSTLLKLVLAMERPKQGTISVAGRDIHRPAQGLDPVRAPQRRRGVPGFQAAAGGLAPRERLARAAGPRAARQGDPRRADKALRRLELDPKTRRPVRCMSGGEQQRVAIARALAGDPPILLADEPPATSTPASAARSSRSSATSMRKARPSCSPPTTRSSATTPRSPTSCSSSRAVSCLTLALTARRGRPPSEGHWRVPPVPGARLRRVPRLAADGPSAARPAPRRSHDRGLHAHVSPP